MSPWQHWCKNETFPSIKRRLCGFWMTCRAQPGLSDAKVAQSYFGVRSESRAWCEETAMAGLRISAGGWQKPGELFTPTGSDSEALFWTERSVWPGLSQSLVRGSLPVRLPLEKQAIKPYWYLSLWGKSRSLSSTLIMHVETYWKNIFPPTLAAVRGS